MLSYKNKVLDSLVSVCLYGILMLGIIDVSLRMYIDLSDLPYKNFVISSGSALQVKLDHLASHEGMKVIVLGDSLIVGRAMKIHGDKSWAQHTFTAQLQKRLREYMPERNPLVMNLGLDGSVPADIEKVAMRVVECEPDLVVLDCSIRSFSEDFVSEESMITRPWLAPNDLSEELSPAGRFNCTVEGYLAAVIQRVWYAYRIRDVIRSCLLGGTVKQGLQSLRDRYGVKSQVSGDDDDVLLLLKAKKRFSSIEINSVNPQMASLTRTLDMLSRAEVPVLLFYAREDPQRLSAVIDDDKYRKLKSEMEACIGPHTSQNVLYHPGADTIPSECYLDHVHVDEIGYFILLDTLWPSVLKLVSGG